MKTFAPQVACRRPDCTHDCSEKTQSSVVFAPWKLFKDHKEPCVPLARNRSPSTDLRPLVQKRLRVPRCPMHLRWPRPTYGTSASTPGRELRQWRNANFRQPIALNSLRHREKGARLVYGAVGSDIRNWCNNNRPRGLGRSFRWMQNVGQTMTAPIRRPALRWPEMAKLQRRPTASETVRLQCGNHDWSTWTPKGDPPRAIINIAASFAAMFPTWMCIWARTSK